MLDGHSALRFPVGVGKAGQAWTGRARSKANTSAGLVRRPTTSAATIRDLPEVIPGGAPNNPMGGAALTMRGGEYAIHGTNNPPSVGGFVSHGCIRMYNSDIRELYQHGRRRHAGDRRAMNLRRLAVAA